MRIGIDVGGTFTDVVLVDDRTGKFNYAKTPTTPWDPAEGVLNGLEKILETANASMADVECIVHGTTIGTNALLERKGAKVGLLTTEGFVDNLEIGRLQRPKGSNYDFRVDNPPPLVPRHLRRGIVERINRKGEVVVPLDENSVEKALDYFESQGIEAIAVSLLFSFLNSSHEERIAELCARRLPSLPVSISSRVCPEFREYERTSTTVINAYLRPVSERYVRNLARRLGERFGEVDLRIMQASGGCMTAEVAQEHAVQMVNSGPAGGATAGAFIGKITGNNLVVGVDMGGTSFDICTIDNATPRTTSDGKIAGLPIKIPIIDIDTIGAGGGSIAWVDKGGALNVGPESAGAFPGPACYGRGGTLPTVTDANLVLGRLSPTYFLGGDLNLYPEKARQAVKDAVADKMELSIEEAASAIIRIVNANMVKGISVNSVEKGYDVRDFAIVAFGGAGALHAVQLARDLNVGTVIVPPLSGNLSALGLLVANTQHDYVRTVAKKQDQVDPAELDNVFKSLEARGMEQLLGEKVPREDIVLLRSADLRYQGQSYEINTPVPSGADFTDGDVSEIVRQFHELHQKLYAYSEPHDTVEFINLRVRAIGKTRPIDLVGSANVQASGGGALKGTRPVYLEGEGFVDTTIYEREFLTPGSVVAGPCIIEEKISSTLLVRGSQATIDRYGNIVVTVDVEVS
ncbi:MAG: hydantoinase/oxoprolinase family protein [Chloroflexi bacterium]|nr:hydantoinase/oxoprolinase family protein [Chloroflexota bacterium]MDA8187849.1 hydantoinase/oxoprolinase family protein [Dehalococcoidales bacterium]